MCAGPTISSWPADLNQPSPPGLVRLRHHAAMGLEGAAHDRCRERTSGVPRHGAAHAGSVSRRRPAEDGALAIPDQDHRPAGPSRAAFPGPVRRRSGRSCASWRSTPRTRSLGGSFNSDQCAWLVRELARQAIATWWWPATTGFRTLTSCTSPSTLPSTCSSDEMTSILLGHRNVVAWLRPTSDPGVRTAVLRMDSGSPSRGRRTQGGGAASPSRTAGPPSTRRSSVRGRLGEAGPTWEVRDPLMRPWSTQEVGRLPQPFVVDRVRTTCRGSSPSQQARHPGDG